MKARGHEGHRPAALRAPEALPSGRAAVPLFWPGSTASANRKRSVRNFPATLGGAFTSCRGPPEFRHFVRTSQTHTFLKNDVSEKTSYFRKVQVVRTEDSRFGIRRTPEATRDVPHIHHGHIASESRPLFTCRSSGLRLTNSFLLADDVDCVTSEEERILQSKTRARACGHRKGF